MALYRHCIAKLVKSNFLSFYVMAVPESSSLIYRKSLESRKTLSDAMTTVFSASSGLRACWQGTHQEDDKQRKRSFSFTVMLVPAIFKGFFSSETEKEPTPEDNLVNHIKRSILLMQNGEPEKAERLLHLALKMAQDLKHEKGITYIYDTMANLAFDNGEFAKAQELFVEVLRRLIGSGLPHDDMIVINISLKLADTFVGLGDYLKSEQGFLFCLDSLKKRISAGASDEDTLVLYAQTLDRYSLFLVQVNRSIEAVKHIENAVEVAESVFGDLNNKVGAILLSDMGVIKIATGETEAASQCFEKALKIANNEEVDTSVAVIMVNRGIALKESGAFKEAKHWCELGLNHAFKEKSKAIRKAAEECLQENSSNEKDKKRAHYKMV